MGAGVRLEKFVIRFDRRIVGCDHPHCMPGREMLKCMLHLVLCVGATLPFSDQALQKTRHFQAIGGERGSLTRLLPLQGSTPVTRTLFPMGAECSELCAVHPSLPACWHTRVRRLSHSSTGLPLLAPSQLPPPQSPPHR